MRRCIKRVCAIALSLFMVGSMMPTMEIKAEANKVNSYIVNGDFEQGLDSWQIVSGDPSAFSIEDGSLKVSSAQTNGSFEIGATAWEVKPATTYVISYDVKIDEFAGLVSFAKYEFKENWAINDNGTVLGEGKVEAVTEGWKKVTYKFTTLEDTAMVQLRLLVNEGGVVYFDNVTMTTEQQSDNIVYNPTFADDAAGWNADTKLEEYTEESSVTETIVYENDFQENAFSSGTVSTEEVNKYMHYEIGNDNPATGVDINIVPGTEYTVSYKLRVNDINGEHSITMGMQEHDPWEGLVMLNDYQISNTDGWVEVTTKFTAAKEHAAFNVVCYGDGNNKASFDIDDFKIAVITKNKKVINKFLEDYETVNEPTFSHGTVEIVADGDNHYQKFTAVNMDHQSKAAVFVEKDKKYRISFKARLIEGDQEVMNIQMLDWGKNNFSSQIQNVTGEWKEYSFDYTAQDSTSCNFVISKWGEKQTVFGIDDLRVDELTDEDLELSFTEGYGENIGYNGEAGLIINTKTDVYNWATGSEGKLVEGKTYAYGFWYKVTGAEEGFTFAPYINNLTDNAISLNGYAESNCDWTYASGEFVAPAKNETEGIRIGFYRQGTGTVYFSGLTVLEKTDVHIHHGQFVEIDKATCNEEGKEAYKCEQCGENVFYNTTTKTDHNWIKGKRVDSTYTEKGYTEYKCSLCGEIEKRDYTDVKPKPEVPTTKLQMPKQVKSVKVKAKKKSLLISWAKVANAKKYQVQVSLTKNFKKTTTYSVKGTKATVKKLKAKKKYYVRVRAVNVSGKQVANGKWSKVLNKKTL